MASTSPSDTEAETRCNTLTSPLFFCSMEYERSLNENVNTGRRSRKGRICRTRRFDASDIVVSLLTPPASSFLTEFSSSSVASSTITEYESEGSTGACPPYILVRT